MDKINPNKKERKQKWLWIVTIFAFVCFVGFLSFIIYSYADLLYGKLNKINSSDFRKSAPASECLDCVRRYIDGVFVKPGEENLYPAAVIIENLMEARPQSGLSQANLVYEAEAEGNITRFLAFFTSSESIKKIGPVRSARPYFIDWAVEFSALFAHCGGSPQALAKISRENIFDLNEFYNGGYFWRDQARPAPHNIYISGEDIKKFLELKEIQGGKYFPWQFKNDISLEARPESSEIEIHFPLPEYLVKWRYNKGENNYARHMAGLPHKDAEGIEIKAKNVVIEFVRSEVIDEELRLRMEHIGVGEAVICLDGKCEKGEWRKPTSEARTRFYRKPPLLKGGSGGFNNNALPDHLLETAQEEFQFNAGATWIEVVRPEYEVIY